MRAYPWQSLPRWSRSQVALSAQMAALVQRLTLGAVRETLATLLEVDVMLAPGPVAASSSARLAQELAPVLTVVALEHPTGRLALELEPALALAVVDRVLGGDGASPAAPAPLSAVEEGVLAFVAARACAGTRCVVSDVLATREGLAAWLGDGDVACWDLRLRLGAREAPLRLWAPARTLARAPSSTETPLATELGELRVDLGLRIGRASLRPGELAALARGDVVLPDELGCLRGGPGAAPEASELRLVATGGACWARLERAGGDWVVSGLERGVSPRRAALVEAGMTDSNRDATATGDLAAVAELPIEVSLELGRIELRVAELAALVPGRVISARLPVGGPVELRAAGRVIALGELVDIEGELGVRVLERR